MERWEMVNNFNNLVDKRTYYRERQGTVSALRDSLNEQMNQCITYCDEIGTHRGEANYFDMLYENNSEIYSVQVSNSISGDLDLLLSYIGSKLQNIQNEINYYDRLIKEYDEEKKKTDNINH